jgi:hypothetical protein
MLLIKMNLKQKYQELTPNFNFQGAVVTFYFNKFNTQSVLRSAHTVYLCVLCGSENKQRLFPYTALTDWSS